MLVDPADSIADRGDGVERIASSPRKEQIERLAESLQEWRTEGEALERDVRDQLDRVLERVATGRENW